MPPTRKVGHAKKQMNGDCGLFLVNALGLFMTICKAFFAYLKCLFQQSSSGFMTIKESRAMKKFGH